MKLSAGLKNDKGELLTGFNITGLKPGKYFIILEVTNK